MTAETDDTKTIRLFALPAAVLINGVFGSLYAWSVFVADLERDLGSLRTGVSAVFSVSIVCFTLGNIVAPLLFGRARPALLTLFAAALGTAGLALASLKNDFATLMIGYGVLFGFAAGFAYNVALQSAQHALPTKSGLANGIAISAFAVGGIIAAQLLSQHVALNGVRQTMWLLGLTVAALVTVGSLLISLSRISLPKQTWRSSATDEAKILSISWLGFVLAAFAGLMTIGHAAPIVLRFGGTVEAAALAVSLLGLGNAIGRMGAGALSDLIGIRSIAGVAHLTGVLGIIAVLASPDGTGAVIAVSLSGLAYGMASSVYPSAVSILLGRAAFGRNFAILLTAWGLAGLTGPYIGGFLFDYTSDYRVPLEIACVALIFALVNAMRLPNETKRGRRGTLVDGNGRH